MSQIKFTELRRYFDEELPGITFARGLSDESAREVIRTFFEQTQQWKEDIDPINTKKEVRFYDLSTPNSQGLIDRFTIVRQRFTDDEETIKLEAEKDYVRPQRNEIELVADPSDDVKKGLEIQVALVPTRIATEICDELFDEWYLIWAKGVKANLMAMKNKRWSDPVRAIQLEREFWDGIRFARSDETKGSRNVNLLATPQFKFA